MFKGDFYMKLDDKSKNRYPRFTNEVIFLFFLAIGSYASAIGEHISDKPVSLWGGKWELLYRWSIETFGEQGPEILWLIIGTICFCSAILKMK
ncbi:MAG: hypothetical protein CTY34_10155 [Methylobacter sp.]|nr:MAG: hypothetical protein CTY34_10155 [Methylobacter sp.]PPD05049.1 MAG: hypothetical protein CTY29_02720 [Methylobacter sp.]